VYILGRFFVSCGISQKSLKEHVLIIHRLPRKPGSTWGAKGNVSTISKFLLSIVSFPLALVFVCSGKSHFPFVGKRHRASRVEDTKFLTQVQIPQERHCSWKPLLCLTPEDDLASLCQHSASMSKATFEAS